MSKADPLFRRVTNLRQARFAGVYAFIGELIGRDQGVESQWSRWRSEVPNANRQTFEAVRARVLAGRAKVREIYRSPRTQAVPCGDIPGGAGAPPGCFYVTQLTGTNPFTHQAETITMTVSSGRGLSLDEIERRAREQLVERAAESDRYPNLAGFKDVRPYGFKLVFVERGGQ